MSILADDMVLYIENSQNKISSLVAQLVKNLLQCRKPGFDPWVRKIPWRRTRQSTPVFWPGEFYGQRRLAIYSPLCRKESDTTERLTLTFRDITSNMKTIVNAAVCYIRK